MPVSPLKRMVDSTLTKRKISPDDARAVLAEVEKDKKFTATEAKELKRLTALPSSRFERRDEYIPSPFDPEDGVTIKADPKKWLESTVEMTTAKLHVKSTVPGISLKLSSIKEFEDADFGNHFARTLDVTVTGKTVAKAGTLAFSYGDRNISIAVKAGESMERVLSKLESSLLRAEGGTLTTEGFYDTSKSGKQTLKFEVL